MEAEVVVWRHELTEATQRALLFRDVRQEFSPELPADLNAKFAGQEQASPQIDFAGKHHLPLMLHIRPSEGTYDAYEESILILDKKVCSNNYNCTLDKYLMHYQNNLKINFN